MHMVSVLIVYGNSGGHEDIRELSDKSGDVVGSGLFDTRLDLGIAHEQNECKKWMEVVTE